MGSFLVTNFKFVYRTTFFVLLGMLLQILDAAEEAVSMSYRTVWTFLELNLVPFLKLYGLSVIGKKFHYFRC